MLDMFQKYALSELSLIAQVPAAFALCMAVIAIIVWRVLVWRYGAVIESLESRNKLQADQIADYKVKLSGATPEEAKNRIDALELQVKSLMPRRLSVEQREKLLRKLNGLSGFVHVVADLGAPDAKLLAADVSTTLKNSGWNIVESQVMGITEASSTGQIIRFNSDIVAEKRAEILSFFRSAGLEFEVGTASTTFVMVGVTPGGVPTQALPYIELLFTSRY